MHTKNWGTTKKIERARSQREVKSVYTALAIPVQSSSMWASRKGRRRPHEPAARGEAWYSRLFLVAVAEHSRCLCSIADVRPPLLYDIRPVWPSYLLDFAHPLSLYGIRPMLPLHLRDLPHSIKTTTLLPLPLRLGYPSAQSKCPRSDTGPSAVLLTRRIVYG